MPLIRLLIAITCLAQGIAALADDPAAADFFEKRVRPILVERCFECHAADKQQGELRLDSLELMLKGNPTGPVIVAGNADASRLIQVIQYAEGDTQMPPNGKLPIAEIETLRQWVQTGAVWGANLGGAAAVDHRPRKPDGSLDFAAAAQSHWAYRPIAHSPTPVVKQPDQCAGPIDRFVLTKLEERGLTFSPLADRHTLARRVYIDLLGVPPSLAEIEAFAQNPDPAAYEQLVDSLQASPMYGQRWGRHWLDVARYADTKGYVFTEERRYPFAFTYRDYVVDSFNADKPYDRFIIEQIAADHLSLPEGDPALAGLGFLTVGRRFLNSTHDIIDDRIDVVTRGLMGLTVTCARCHDHKYDPILAADYYGLYGVFAGCHEPEAKDLPLVGQPTATPEYVMFTEELGRRTQVRDGYIAQGHAEMVKIAREHVGDYLQAVVVKRELASGQAPQYDHGDPREKLTERWREWINTLEQQDHSAIRPWKRLAQIPPAEFAAQVNQAITEIEAQPSANPLIVAALKASPPQSMLEAARLYGRLLGETWRVWMELASQKDTPAPQRLSDEHQESLRQILAHSSAPPQIPVDRARSIFGRDHSEKLRDLQKQIDALYVEAAGAPPRAMVLLDNAAPHDPVIFERGNPDRRGPAVPRQFIRVLSSESTPPFQGGSGRLELAQMIASPTNPLTARVIANRVWLLHFGQGLTITPGDFGVRSDPPSHPELLDHLAHRLMASGWSIKALHREILLSHTYRQASVDNAAARELDSENRLLWRQNRRRLDFEAMRDGMLSAASLLDSSLGGRSVDIESTPLPHRRGVYAFIDRNNFSGLLRTFDFPTPDASSPERPRTSVPQQSLYGLNSAFVTETSRSLASEAAQAGSTPDQVRRLYQKILSRAPSDEEQLLAERYASEDMNGLMNLAQVLLLTNEFWFVD